MRVAGDRHRITVTSLRRTIMHIFWGLIIADLGALFIVWGRTKSVPSW